MNFEVLYLLNALLTVVTATLTIRQGRIVFASGLPRVTVIDVEGVTTVQVGGTNPPSYYLDCFTTAPTSTSADLRWSRETGQLTVGTESSAMGVGLRLLLEQVEHGELGVYVCTDTNTGEEVRVKVTDENPAVCPVEYNVTIAANNSAQLDVYVSGIPVPTADQIHWYRPNGTEIMDGDENVQFDNNRKRLILCNIQQSDAGTYHVGVVLQEEPDSMRDRIGINLIVLGTTNRSTSDDDNARNSTICGGDIENEEATLTLQQGRIAFTGGVPGVMTIDVEGVATVQVGGTNPPSYYIDCLTTAPTSADLRWSRETGQLTIGTEPSAMGVGLRLLLEMVDENELDVYVCTNISTGKSIQVRVTDDNPAVLPVEDMITTETNHSAQLDVYVSGFPVPRANQIHWYRPSGVEIMDGDENVRFNNSRKRLILSNIQQSDAGTYDVEVVLQEGHARTGIKVVVQEITDTSDPPGSGGDSTTDGVDMGNSEGTTVTVPNTNSTVSTTAIEMTTTEGSDPTVVSESLIPEGSSEGTVVEVAVLVVLPLMVLLIVVVIVILVVQTPVLIRIYRRSRTNLLNFPCGTTGITDGLSMATSDVSATNKIFQEKQSSGHLSNIPSTEPSAQNEPIQHQN